ncbi:hypothetical protein KCU88_g6673, partial [Aureobasidium melanogenum]
MTLPVMAQSAVQPTVDRLTDGSLPERLGIVIRVGWCSERRLQTRFSDDTDPKDVEIDSAGAEVGEDTAFFAEDEELPDEYWRKQHDELNDSDFEEQDYDPNTVVSLDRVKAQWEDIKWPVPEVLYDPSLILSPHVYLLSLIVADHAFEAPGPVSPEELSRLYVLDFKNEQRVPLVSKLDDFYVFRQARKTPYGVEIPFDSPLSYATLLPWVKNLGRLIGLINVIPYDLRYNAAAKFDANGKLKPVTLQISNTVNTQTCNRSHYLPRRINVDTRAIVHGLEPQRAMMKAASRMSRSIDPRRPHELTEEQSLSVNKHPRIRKLVGQRDKLRRKFKGTIKSNKGTPLYEQYADLGRDIVNERQHLRKALMKNVRKK